MTLETEHDIAEALRHAAPYIGLRMKDGTIFAGLSPEDGRPMYATAEDAPLRLGFNAAASYAAALEVDGRRGFRVPSQNELLVLFENQQAGALAGTFTPAPFSVTQDSYRSSTPHETGDLWDLTLVFSNGTKNLLGKDVEARLRCIRSGDWPTEETAGHLPAQARHVLQRSRAAQKQNVLKSRRPSLAPAR